MKSNLLQCDSNIVWYKVKDVSEVRTASIFRFKEYAKQAAPLLLGLFSKLEYGGSESFRNIGKFLPDYMAPHSRS
jgi:hypothetical protein